MLRGFLSASSIGGIHRVSAHAAEKSAPPWFSIFSTARSGLRGIRSPHVPASSGMPSNTTIEVFIERLGSFLPLPLESAMRAEVFQPLTSLSSRQGHSLAAIVEICDFARPRHTFHARPDAHAAARRCILRAGKAPAIANPRELTSAQEGRHARAPALEPSAVASFGRVHLRSCLSCKAASYRCVLAVAFEGRYRIRTKAGRCTVFPSFLR